MRLAIAVGSAVLALLVACTSSYFVITREPTDKTHSEVVDSLLLKGYTLDEVTENKIETHWRKEVLNRYEDNETWFRWKLSVFFKEEGNVVKAECQEQRAKSLRENWFWVPCENELMRSVVGHSAEDL